MDKKEFLSLRQKFQKTQRELSQLLGVSMRAVQSFEQGWRQVPVHAERQMLFLQAMKKRVEGKIQPCWEIRGCPPDMHQACPAWEFQAGDFCWFISGTICQGKLRESWSKKIKVCRKCRVFASNMKA